MLNKGSTDHPLRISESDIINSCGEIGKIYGSLLALRIAIGSNYLPATGTVNEDLSAGTRKGMPNDQRVIGRIGENTYRTPRKQLLPNTHYPRYVI